MRNTASLQRMATTRVGMRKILKQQLAPVDYIKKAVQTGVYKKIYHPDEDMQNKNRRGGGRQQQRQPNPFEFAPKVDPYPFEYEVLTLNPPLPFKPRLSKKDLRFLQLEKASAENGNGSKMPTEKLVKKYMQRYDNRMKSASPMSDAQREDEYYRNILGVSGVKNSNSSSDGSDEDLSTAMSRKPAVLNHAYEFSLKQYQVLSENENMTEDESISIVEEILAKEEKDERMQSRMKAQKLAQEMKEKKEQKEEQQGQESNAKSTTALSTSSSSTSPVLGIPSILYSKPRTIQALHIWGQRFQAVPYNQWTLGASTALDHWIAVDVLGMKEETWNRLLRGELESDIQQSRSDSDDLIIGDMARMKDIVTVRSALFPETVAQLLEEEEEEAMAMEEEYGEPEDVFDAIDAEKEATERSVDELLASLGGFGDEDEDDDEEGSEKETVASGNTISNDDDDLDSRISYMVDSLQDWRTMNAEKPFDEWSYDEKQNFDNWLSEYLSLVTTENDGEVDLVATRDALLSEPPLDRDSSNKFWSQVQDEADAEIFLHDIREKGLPQKNDNESAADMKARESLELFLSLPYEKQLRQVINLGTLRPVLDEYYKETDRLKFMDQHIDKMLEGIEVEHLVTDPDGHITVQDIGDDYLTREERSRISPNTKFSIKMIPFGTDEFGMSRSEKSRMLYRAWNEQKAGRAKYAESQFRKGKTPLKEG